MFFLRRFRSTASFPFVFEMQNLVLVDISDICGIGGVVGGIFGICGICHIAVLSIISNPESLPDPPHPIEQMNANVEQTNTNAHINTVTHTGGSLLSELYSIASS